MGRPLNKNYYDQLIWENTDHDIIMTGAWVDGASDWEPCYIVEQVSTNSFLCKQAYTDPPTSSVCTLVPHDAAGPGQMFIKYGNFISGSVYYSGDTEGYASSINDNTLRDFEGRTMRWQIEGSIFSAEAVDGKVWIWTSGYIWAP